MNTLQSALKSQDNDYVENPHLFLTSARRYLTTIRQEKKLHTRE